MAAAKYYAVRVGRQTGIFRTWADCEAQVKGYSGAVYKSFPTEEEAQRFLGEMPKEAADAVILYTDGSCLKNDGDGPGGYAAILQNDGDDYEVLAKGADTHTTNNRMEFTAVLEGLKALYQRVGGDADVVVRSDSMLVVNHKTWKLENETLVKLSGEILEWEGRFRSVTYEKVGAAHNVRRSDRDYARKFHKGNDMADKTAVEEAKKICDT